jgi:RNA polymerase sigma factor (sigma-70 family)
MRGRDEADFTEFAAAVVRQLRRTAYLMCGDWHSAENAAQAALVRVYRRWDKLNRQDGLTTYAHKVLVSSVLDQAKRNPRPEQAGEIDDRQPVVAALAGIPAGPRACVVLRHYAELTIEDTAQVLGVSAGTVQNQTTRGLALLREQLSERAAS